MFGGIALHRLPFRREKNADRSAASTQEPGNDKAVAAIIALATEHHRLQTGQTVPARLNRRDDLGAGPLHQFDAGYARLCERSPVPIATGEAESRYKDFERLLVDGLIDWIQPDPGRCGISTMVEVGRLAHRLHRKVVNHSFKSGITIAASLHGLAAAPHGEVFEYCMSDSPLRHDLTHEKFKVIDGYVHIPEGPGLGVTIDKDVVEKYRIT